MKLIYGNPSYESVEIIKNSILLKEWISKGIFDELIQIQYPSEEVTRQELLHLLQLSNNLDSDRLEKIRRFDTDLFGLMSEFLQSYGINHSKEQVYANIEIYDPIMDYLKIKFNRPRPFQDAAYYQIPLYPKLKTDASTASYPSGHTFLALCFFDYYSKRYPKLNTQLLEFALDVKLSREEGGVHYPSDGVYSFKIYNHIKKYMNT
jgi:membrane-associated phospholipid phosphatase